MDYPSQYGWRGQREDRTRTTRYSCSTVVGHVIVNRETRVQTRLDHQSGTKNDILLGVHKKSLLQLRCSQPWASDAEALGLNLTPSILNFGSGLELAYNRSSCILLPCTTLECKLVAVSYQEYECGVLYSKSVEIDSAFRKQHFPFAYLLCNTPCFSPKFWKTFVFNFSWVLQSSQEELKRMRRLNVWGANKVYDGRCANGEWSPVPFVRCSCHCGCEREGSDIKRDGKVSCFIICHCGKKPKVAFRTWQLHFLHHPRYTHVRKIINTLSYVSRVGLKLCLSLSVAQSLALYCLPLLYPQITLTYSFLPKSSYLNINKLFHFPCVKVLCATIYCPLFTFTTLVIFHVIHHVTAFDQWNHPFMLLTEPCKGADEEVLERKESVNFLRNFQTSSCFYQSCRHGLIQSSHQAFNYAELWRDRSKNGLHVAACSLQDSWILCKLK